MKRINNNWKGLSRTELDRRASTWSREGKRKSERSKNIIRQEIEAGMKSMNRNWKKLERIG
ncbi:unnamed protein product [Schistosoma curassoni]|uniref:IENR2 domain-containing protein n=1 Tax=Schistosoma curassoni TaxID=6186 RepID=A0A183K4K2_9TREM|nr:unnamed protein product [Schistosoma curassoni]